MKAKISINHYDNNGQFQNTEIREVPVVFSDSGVCHGYGSDRYKWVSGLSKDEREMVKNKTGVVIVEAARRSGGNTGTYYREVTYESGRYGRRVPSFSEEQIDKVRYAE